MGKYALKSDVRGREFSRKYLLFEGLKWDECKEGKNPYEDDVLIPARTYPIFISFFMQAGLKISFDPLLVDFLRKTSFYLSQITPNTFRIILGIA